MILLITSHIDSFFLLTGSYLTITDSLVLGLMLTMSSSFQKPGASSTYSSFDFRHPLTVTPSCFSSKHNILSVSAPSYVLTTGAFTTYYADSLYAIYFIGIHLPLNFEPMWSYFNIFFFLQSFYPMLLLEFKLSCQSFWIFFGIIIFSKITTTSFIWWYLILI